MLPKESEEKKPAKDNKAQPSIQNNKTKENKEKSEKKSQSKEKSERQTTKEKSSEPINHHRLTPRVEVSDVVASLQATLGGEAKKTETSTTKKHISNDIVKPDKERQVERDKKSDEALRHVFTPRSVSDNVESQPRIRKVVVERRPQIQVATKQTTDEPETLRQDPIPQMGGIRQPAFTPVVQAEEPDMKTVKKYYDTVAMSVFRG